MQKNMRINVISLFDGISCGRVALERAGIKVDNYYASEIDKYAIHIAQKNYPDTIQLGDIKNIKVSSYKGGGLKTPDLKFEKIDLLMGGSPCQGFSFAGKQLNFDDPRSKLFFEFVRILKEVKPKYFLLENVRMKKEYQDIISEQLGVKPIMINSALVSAQSRKRLYWTNIPNIGQPKDKEIYLSDILLPEEEVDEKYYIKNINEIKWVINTERLRKKYTAINPDKSLPMLARQYASWNGNYYAEPVRLINIGNGGQGERVYYVNAKSTTLSAMGGGRGAKTGLYLVAQRGRNIVDGKRKDVKGAKTEQRFETRFDGKTNTITTVQKDNYVLIEIDNEYYRIRKLTPVECCRLQTMDDFFTDGISDSQQYKALGNGWTVDVLAHIFKNIKCQSTSHTTNGEKI